jgi:hypothetical protein
MRAEVTLEQLKLITPLRSPLSLRGDEGGLWFIF